MRNDFKHTREFLHGLEKALIEMEGQSALKHVTAHYADTLRSLVEALDIQYEEITRFRKISEDLLLLITDILENGWILDELPEVIRAREALGEVSE